MNKKIIIRSTVSDGLFFGVNVNEVEYDRALKQIAEKMKYPNQPALIISNYIFAANSFYNGLLYVEFTDGSSDE